MDKLVRQFEVCSASIRSAESSIFQNEQNVIENYQILIDDVRTYFQDNHFFIAEKCLDFLLGKKKTEDGGWKMRKDDVTHDFIHELRQVVGIKSFVDEGLLQKECEYGSVEVLFSASLMHDMGEDYNVLPDEVVYHLSEKVGRSDKLSTDERRNYFQMARRVASVMEAMTFDRKYSHEDICSILGKPEDSELSKRDLSEFLRRLKSGMKTTESIAKNLEIHREVGGKERYIVSSHFSKFFEGIILDWNKYVGAMLEDPYAMLAKFFDSNEGQSTRIYEGFSMSGYDHYLDRREQIFMLDNVALAMVENYPEIGSAINSVNSMSFVLYKIGRTFVNHHKKRGVYLEKGFSSHTMRPIDFRGHMQPALEGYGGVPCGLNPLGIIMSRIGEIDPNLHDKIEESLEAQIGTNFSRSKLLHNPSERGLG
jgi:hypothetical protein